MNTNKSSPAPTVAPKNALVDQWRDIARKWLAWHKADSSMLITCYHALQIDDPELAEQCKNESQRRRKSVKLPPYA